MNWKLELQDLIRALSPDAEAMAAKLWELEGFPVPVDIEAIARIVNIQSITQVDFSKKSGLLGLSLDRTEGYIWVSQHGPETRRRFAVGHELGHFLSPHHKSHIVIITHKPNFTCPKLSPLEEQETKTWEDEADAFAAAMLMPFMAVQPFVAREPSIGLFKDVARHFDVSFAAAGRRILQLSSYPIGIATIKGDKINSLETNKYFPDFAVQRHQRHPFTRPESTPGQATWEHTDPGFWFGNPDLKGLVVQKHWQMNDFATLLFTIQ